MFGTVNVTNVYLLMTITKAIYRTHLQYRSWIMDSFVIPWSVSISETYLKIKDSAVYYIIQCQKECNLILHNLTWLSSARELDLEYFSVRSVIRKTTLVWGKEFLYNQLFRLTVVSSIHILYPNMSVCERASQPICRYTFINIRNSWNGKIKEIIDANMKPPVS